MGRPPDCNPCCEEPGGFDPPECGVCGAEDYPEQYQVTFSSITDSSCTGCDILNDTFTMTHAVAPYDTDCNWFYCLDGGFNEGGSCLSDRIGFRFRLGRLDIYRMTANCGGVYGVAAVYRRLSGDPAYDCDDHTAVLSLESSGPCSNWPASITVSAVS